MTNSSALQQFVTFINRINDENVSGTQDERMIRQEFAQQLHVVRNNWSNTEPRQFDAVVANLINARHVIANNNVSDSIQERNIRADYVGMLDGIIQTLRNEMALHLRTNVVDHRERAIGHAENVRETTADYDAWLAAEESARERDDENKTQEQEDAMDARTMFNALCNDVLNERVTCQPQEIAIRQSLYDTMVYYQWSDDMPAETIVDQLFALRNVLELTNRSRTEQERTARQVYVGRLNDIIGVVQQRLEPIANFDLLELIGDDEDDNELELTVDDDDDDDAPTIDQQLYDATNDKSALIDYWKTALVQSLVVTDDATWNERAVAFDRAAMIARTIALLQE